MPLCPPPGRQPRAPGRTLRLAGLRSRPIYLAVGTGLLAFAVGCVTAVARLDAHNDPSLADVFGFIGLLASWAALLSLGRALTWGRLRRLCWVYPPDGPLSASTRGVTSGSGLC